MDEDILKRQKSELLYWKNKSESRFIKIDKLIDKYLKKCNSCLCKIMDKNDEGLTTEMKETIIDEIEHLLYDLKNDKL